VLALLGDNGAGKSTLIKCMSGVHRLDAGTIYMDGQPVDISSPASARAHGIETVYQDLALFDNLDPGRELLRRARAGRSALVAARPALHATA
jgi:ABC-type sugar transport system ATPase subunit